MKGIVGIACTLTLVLTGCSGRSAESDLFAAGSAESNPKPGVTPTTGASVTAPTSAAPSVPNPSASPATSDAGTPVGFPSGSVPASPDAGEPPSQDAGPPPEVHPIPDAPPPPPSQCNFQFAIPRDVDPGNAVSGPGPFRVNGTGNTLVGRSLIVEGNNNEVRGTNICVVGRDATVRTQGQDIDVQWGDGCQTRSCPPLSCGNGRTLSVCLDGECLNGCVGRGTGKTGQTYGYGILPDGRFSAQLGSNSFVVR